MEFFLTKRVGTLNNYNITFQHFVFVCRSIYAARGRKDKRSYNYVHETWEGDKISFIAVDACPDPGPRRPFNFFGVLSQVIVSSVL